MDNNLIDIDDLIRQRMGGAEEPILDGAWNRMSALLEEDKKRRPFFWWFNRGLGMVGVLVLASLITVGGYKAYDAYRGQGGSTTEGVAGNAGNNEQHTGGAKALAQNNIQHEASSNNTDNKNESNSSANVASKSPSASMVVAHKADHASVHHLSANASGTTAQHTAQPSTVSNNTSGGNAATKSVVRKHMSAASNTVQESKTAVAANEKLDVASKVEATKPAAQASNDVPVAGKSTQALHDQPIAARHDANKNASNNAHRNVSALPLASTSGSAKNVVPAVRKTKGNSPAAALATATEGNDEQSSQVAKAPLGKQAVRKVNDLNKAAQKPIALETPNSKGAVKNTKLPDEARVTESVAQNTDTRKTAASKKPVKKEIAKTEATPMAATPVKADEQKADEDGYVTKQRKVEKTNIRQRTTGTALRKQVKFDTISTSEEFETTRTKVAAKKPEAIQPENEFAASGNNTPTGVNAVDKKAAPKAKGTGTTPAAQKGTTPSGSVASTKPAGASAPASASTNPATASTNVYNSAPPAASAPPKPTPSDTAASTPPASKPEVKKQKSYFWQNVAQSFNEMKYNFTHAQFSPGLTAGVNSTFFGPSSFTGFHFGATGNFALDEKWSIFTELKYFHRMNNDFEMQTAYNKYTALTSGNGYYKDSTTRTFAFSTLHSFELPISIRFAVNKLTMFAGANLQYIFSINTGASDQLALPNQARKVVNTIENNSVPALNDGDFGSRFAVGYLLGFNFNVSNNMSLDLRSAQNFWDNAQSLGAKDVSSKLYNSPSLQFSVYYKFGGKKDN